MRHDKMKTMDEKSICPICGYVGNKVRFSRGSYLLEIFLWCVLFIPGALYTTWRSFNEYHACPVCKNKEMIPVGTELGKKISEEKVRMNQPIPARDLLNVLRGLLRG